VGSYRQSLLQIRVHVSAILEAAMHGGYK